MSYVMIGKKAVTSFESTVSVEFWRCCSLFTWQYWKIEEYRRLLAEARRELVEARRELAKAKKEIKVLRAELGCREVGAVIRILFRRCL